MANQRLLLKNIQNNDSPKYVKIVDAFKKSIEANTHKLGDRIPSINEFSKEYNVSRDTVYKAYTLLKKQGLIQSTPNKGYYITKGTKKVLLLISTFKAYKEVFYHSFMDCLPKNVIVDLQFHHYNIKNFKSMLDVNNLKYYKYIVMGFDHPEVNKIVSKIDKDKLLLIDWKANLKVHENFVFQDFGEAFYNCLVKAKDLFKKYNKLVFVYPEFSHHPYESVDYFMKFCEYNNFDYRICNKYNRLTVERNTAYVCVNDRVLYTILDQSNEANFKIGNDVGVLSYNDTPLKKFTFKGISVISINFKEFGAKVAQFIKEDKPMQTYLKTELILRDSL